MAESSGRVGRYELLEVIGRGGTAIVYLANQPDLERLVALKELSPHHAGDPSFAERFVAESRLIGAMNHPNIVTIHEFFEDDGLPYIAMEYLPRGSLRPYLTSLTLAQTLGVAEDMLSALAHAESRHTIHRDLKPENLLVTADGHVKISDYGVARALDTVVPRSFATMTGTTIGTPAYMAPEQALGEALGPQADLYSLGIIIWEALAGRPPFTAEDTPMALLYKQIHEPIPPIGELVPDIDPELARWLDVMLDKTPAHRFISADAAWDQLEEIAIRLLGPRWRREARIDLALAGELELSPDAADGVADTHTDEPVRDAPAAWGRRDTDAAVPTAGGDTLMRNSRRHADADEQTEETEAPARRWPLWVATALAALVAAGAGVGVGLASTPSAPAAATHTQTTPTVALAAAVEPVLVTLSNEQRAELKQLKAAHTGSAQSAAAGVLAGDYLKAEKALEALPASERDVPAETALDRAIKTLAADWKQASTAAKSESTQAYDAARSALRRDTGRLAVRAAAADTAA